MTFEELLSNPPVVHESGTTTVHHLSKGAIQFLNEHLFQGASTLETGIGLSTALFALKGSDHVCIAPFEEEVQHLRQYCANHKISLEKTEFVIQPSEIALPQIHHTNLDFVLIDGNHAFPIPFIDYHYASKMLKVGGYLIIDDTHIWTGKVLKDFLHMEQEWEIVANLFDRTAVFKKKSDTNKNKWHGEQPYVMLKSAWTIKKSQLLQLLWFAKKGDWKGLKTKLAKKLHAK